MYKVYYMNVYLRSFRTRDEALDWRLVDANRRGVSIGDYEILDRSDNDS